MTYHVGIGPMLAAALGEPPGDPYVKCDECGNCVTVLTKRGLVAQWFQRRRRAPGWAMRYNGDGGGGIDAKCPACLREEREGKL